ncbi:MAG: acireductone synthase [Acidobacteria bacterium]|nr:acireductone synthase [Acidobacteriota bacterium]
MRGILLDIEGSTTPIAFVHDVLFPFARERLKDCLRRNFSSEEVRGDVAKLREEHAADVELRLEPPPWVEDPLDAQRDSIVAYVHWLMDRDRKSTGLKSLQGKIWEEGYLSGELKGQVFPDVPPALQRWCQNGIDIRIFSSGSALAQKLLFAHTEAGDLTRFLRGYFDTTTGGKTALESYRRIAAQFRLPPPEILFVSDTTAELDAAKSAGMQALLCARPGNRPQPPGHGHRTIHSFSEII